MFLSTMADITKAQTARIEKHLNQKICFNGNFMSRKEFVNKRIVEEGFYPEKYVEWTSNKDGKFTEKDCYVALSKIAENWGTNKRDKWRLTRADGVFTDIAKTDYEYALVAFKYFNQNKTLDEIMEKYGLTIEQATELLDKATELQDKYKKFLPKI